MYNKQSASYRLRSQRRCVTHDCERPVSTPSSNDQQMLRNFDTFSPPLTAKCFNCFNPASSDKWDKSFHSNLLNDINHYTD